MKGFDSITLNLPYPPSANRYWRIFRNRAVVSAEAKEFKQTVVKNVLYEGVKTITSDFECKVSVTLHPKQTKALAASKTCIDLDNCLKVALDALQGAVYVNDRQVKEIEAKYGEPKPNGGLTVTVSKIIDDEKSKYPWVW